jgi:predicted dehydrogenase
MLKALVIGAGSIGALKNDRYDSPTTESILTHAHAYYNNPDIELVGIIDVDINKAKQASCRWNCHYGQHLISYKMDNIDIISVCTPTETHYKILKECIQLKPKVVIAEKPFCENLERAKEIAELYVKEGIELLINYPRRYVPEIQNLSFALNSGEYGEIYSATFHYTRGLRHEMCHGIDLCDMLFGDFEYGKLLQSYFKIIDRDERDPTYAAYLSFNRCHHVFFSPCDGRKYKVFQLEIMTEKGKIILSSHGMYIEFYPAVVEEIWGGFNVLSKDLAMRQKTQLDKSLVHIMIEAVSLCNDLNPTKSCNEANAIRVHEIIEHLKRGE